MSQVVLETRAPAGKDRPPRAPGGRFSVDGPLTIGSMSAAEQLLIPNVRQPKMTESRISPMVSSPTLPMQSAPGISCCNSDPSLRTMSLP